MRSFLPTFATLALVAASTSTGQNRALGPDEIFSDGFESGDVSAWSSAVGWVPPADAFRFSDLDLRDPHVFLEVDLGIPICLDFTDTPLPVVNFSFNGSLQEQITGDQNDDGLLDASFLLLFRPLDLAAVGERLDLASGTCTAPIETTTCDEDPVTPPVITAYDSEDSGICLETLPATTSGYSPAINEPGAPCFVNAATDIVIDLAGVPLTLRDAQFAGTWVGDPPSTLLEGLIRGFLTEADADATLLPPELPLVGGQPLSVILPGGTGNCASGDDRDIWQTDSGWWFYFDYLADEVDYSGR